MTEAQDILYKNILDSDSFKELVENLVENIVLIEKIEGYPLFSRDQSKDTWPFHPGIEDALDVELDFNRISEDIFTCCSVLGVNEIPSSIIGELEQFILYKFFSLELTPYGCEFIIRLLKDFAKKKLHFIKDLLTVKDLEDFFYCKDDIMLTHKEYRKMFKHEIKNIDPKLVALLSQYRVVEESLIKRKAISKSVRFDVFKRDSFTCQYCGRKAPDVILVIDHINPVANGGDNDILNLVTSCFECNSGKGAKLLSENTTLSKQHRQAQELQEKHEQQLMLIEWKKALRRIPEDIVEELADYWHELTENMSTLTDYGKKQLAALCRKYSVTVIMDSMVAALDKMGNSSGEERQNAFNYIEKVCRYSKLVEKKPYMQEIYYIRGILRNRFAGDTNYTKLKNRKGKPIDVSITECLETAHLKGITLECLKEIALESTSYHGWQEQMVALQDDYVVAEA